MRHLIILLIFLSFSQLGFGQVVTDLKVTGRHAQLIERGTSAKTKKDRKQEQVRQTRKKGEAMRDTLSTLDSAHLAIDDPLPNDSLSIALPDAEVISENELDTRLEEEAGGLASHGGMTRAEGADLSAISQQGIGDLPEGELPGGISTGKSGLSPEGLSTTAFIPTLNLNPGAMNMVKMQSLMENISFEKLTDAHLSMEALKTTYSSVPSLTDTSSWIKSRSLKGQPLIDRFFIGGNMSITSTDPLAIDISMQVGFRIDRHLSAGVGGIWRESFHSRQDSAAFPVSSSHGWSVFSRYKFGKGFFTLGEYSRMRNSPLMTEERGSKPWQNQYLLGIGREFHIANFIQMSTAVLYDFNYRHNDLHPRPFIVRIGYTLDRPRFGKGK